MVGMGGAGSHWRSFRTEAPGKLKLDRALLRRVGSYARPYTLQIALMLGTIFAAAGLGLIPPLLYRDLFDHAIPQRSYARLNLLAVGMVGIPLLSGLVGVLQRYLSAKVGEGIIYDLRRSLYEHMQRMSLRFFTETKTGELMSRLNNDVVGAQQALTSTITTLLSNTVTFLATLVVMLTLEWRLTLLAALVLPLLILPARRVAALLRVVAREQMERNARMNTLMNETLNVSGALLVKLFGRSTMETERFSSRAAAVRDAGIRQSLIGRWFFFGLSLASALGAALVFWMGGRLVLSGQFTVGLIVAFTAYLSQFYGPLIALTNARVDLATSLVSFERVFEVLDLPLEIADRPGAFELEQVRGDVASDHVSFRYQKSEAEAASPVLAAVERRWSVAERPLSEEDGQKATTITITPTTRPQTRRWALEDVSFEVKAGQLAAIVGPSGAGKTTLSYLLPRLYDPTEGRVLIDGYDLRDLTLGSLTRHIGMVTQETYLFHDTIRANLLYARPDASMEEVEAACRAANIEEFIRELPDGYDTVVGERGYRLSGGEKQRISIARVILQDPRILVLDEATSHLDSHSEAAIQAALERIMVGRTSLVIAHRLSTILSADVILVMNRGKLMEHGTHEELLAAGGLYAKLYRTQFRTAAARA